MFLVSILVSHIAGTVNESNDGDGYISFGWKLNLELSGIALTTFGGERRAERFGQQMASINHLLNQILRPRKHRLVHTIGSSLHVT